MTLPSFQPHCLPPQSRASVVTAATAVWNVLLGVRAAGVCSSTIFLFMVLVAAIRWRREARAARTSRARNACIFPASPSPSSNRVHGMEARLEENLESFFRQDYPAFEIVLGARDASDAGLQLAERVRQRHPAGKEPDRRIGPANLAQCQGFLAEQDDSVLRRTTTL